MAQPDLSQLSSRAVFSRLGLVANSDDLVDDPSGTLIGICLCLLNISLSSLGWILQRKSGLVRSGRSSCLLATLGTIFYVLSALPDVVAYTKIPETLAAILGCFRTVVVCMLGHFFLKERLATRDWMAIAIVMTGGIVCVFFGPKATELANGSHVEIDAYPLNVFRYMVIAWLLTVCSFISIHLMLRSKLPGIGHLAGYNIVFTTAIAYALEKVYNSELGKVNIDRYHLLWIQTLSCVAFLGVLDFYMNFLAAWNLPAHLFDPLKFSLCTLFQLFQGVFILDEFELMSTWQRTLTFAGAALALVGSLLIWQGTTSHDGSSSDIKESLITT